MASVRRFDLDGGSRVVVKSSADPAMSLEIEGRMLADLAQRSSLPVPEVLHAEPTLLVMTCVEHDGVGGAGGQRHAAELLAGLHGVTPLASDVPDGWDPRRSFGYPCDTLIGALPQANGWRDSWIGFFRERRLLAMAARAHNARGITTEQRGRIDRLAERLDDLLIEPDAASLLHGDVWGGNVLYHAGCVAAFIDPAISFGHPEIELAFGTLFGTFGESFFDAYRERRPIEPGFFEARRDLYNVYPLLVHATMFGGGYGSQADAIVRRFV